MPSIRILNVATNQEKVTKLCQSVQNHFDIKEKVLIAVSNEEAAKYLDLLLWRFPPESFLPHKISETPSDSSVIITTTNLNLNQAKVLLNLLPSIHPHYQEYEIVYEIFDTTDPAKKEVAQKKISFYQANQISIA